MKTDKADRRKLRKAELENFTITQLNEIKPYKKDTVLPTKTELADPRNISKAEMIETILSHEGLGSE